jgi:hypothetical protein
MMARDFAGFPAGATISSNISMGSATMGTVDGALFMSGTKFPSDNRTSRFVEIPTIWSNNSSAEGGPDGAGRFALARPIARVRSSESGGEWPRVFSRRR